MLKEFKTETLVEMRSLDNTWQISKQNLCIVHKFGVTNVWAQCREGITCYLRKCSCDLNYIKDKYVEPFKMKKMHKGHLMLVTLIIFSSL
jgi:hypothetical protein